MKAYCENCISLQPSSFRPGSDAVTGEPYEDLRCNTCGFIVATVQDRVAQPEQEPVAYPEGDVVGPCVCGSWPGGKCFKCPRITTPPKRTWVGLTDGEIQQCYKAAYKVVQGRQLEIAFARALETYLREKNT